jgi:hypothetical protein
MIRPLEETSQSSKELVDINISVNAFVGFGGEQK